MYFRNAPTPLSEISEGGLPASIEKIPTYKKRHSIECRSFFIYRSAMPASAISAATATAIAASVASTRTSAVMAAVAAVIAPRLAAAVVATGIVAITGIAAAIAVVTPTITGRSAGLVITWNRWRRVIARRRGVVAWLRRYIDAPLLVISRTVAIVISVSTSNNGCGLGIHIGFVVTGTSIATSKSQSQ